MNILNKNELKDVTGGATDIEYALADSILTPLIGGNFSLGVINDVLNFITANNYQVVDDILGGTASYNFDPTNTMATTITGVHLLKIIDGNTMMLATQNNFKVIQKG